ncbi:malto-oligosyltrehalose synthase [Microbacterium pumilum]|uniref:Malto-oligosyltrehalose synthase n=1 Tax=Microbacterium pumilum TaxID=344165 RepID=A0ABP5E393_9MICO
MTSRPLSTYRLQIRQDFDLDAAAAVTSYLRDLGVSWAYLSPLLKAGAGSDHGYDVVDPSTVDPARGGKEGLDRFAAAARTAGLGILIDIVPNHTGVGVPAANPWWWDVLTHGRSSRYAAAFDIDWDFGGGKVRLPILGGTLDEVIGDIRIEAEATAAAPYGTLRFFDHVLPLAPGSADDGADARTVLDRQHYEAVFWRREAAELNYRRFFTVTTLAGVRVEEPEVFAETHVEILRWVREGLADGLRVDHPDGLLDPGGYLEQLAAATGGAYVVVEKILEHGEVLPAWWETDGTTGYDALAEIDRVLVDPAGDLPLGDLDAQLRGGPLEWGDLIHDTKRAVADTTQAAEVQRLVRALPQSVDGAADAFSELLAGFPVYRSYLPAGEEHLDAAARTASARRPDLAAAIGGLLSVLKDADTEVSRRFQQTTGPVMAKGVEDTAFYRYSRLGSLTEVGGDPSVFSLSAAQFHAARADRQASWPHAMTALSTHDTKRGEDVRARLAVLAEIPERWSEVLHELRSHATTGNGPLDALLWQAVIGSWPATPERLHTYAEKASREASEQTGWLDPDAVFEGRVHAVVDGAFGPAASIVDAFVAEIETAGWSNSLSAKVLQLVGPGVPDVYQGSELWDHSLVDPDNRRPVDFALRARLLAEIDAGAQPPVDATGAAKLLVTARSLRLKRDRPDLFARYTPMSVVGEAGAHAVAFDRGGALAVATRLPVGLARRGGWGDTVLLRHSGSTTDVFTGRRFEGSTIPLRDLLATYPVALLAADA